MSDPDVIPFSVADMDLLCAPEVTQALTQAAAFGLHGYTGLTPEYRDAVCGWMARRHGWACPADIERRTR